MKNIWLHIVLLLIVADSASLCQFIKLPVLFDHFREHRQVDNQITFVEFLSMHYWGDDLNDDDDDRDMQLPFKKVDVHAHYLFVPDARIISIRKTGLSISASYPIHYNCFYSNPSLGSTFRPPCS